MVYIYSACVLQTALYVGDPSDLTISSALNLNETKNLYIYCINLKMVFVQFATPIIQV